MWALSWLVPGRRLFSPSVSWSVKNKGGPPTTYGFSGIGIMLIWHSLEAIWSLFDALCAWATLARLRQQQQQQRQQCRWPRQP